MNSSGISKASMSNNNPTSSEDLRAQGGDAFSKVRDAANEAMGSAQETASSLASEANENVKSFLNQQVAVGADLVGRLSRSVRVAADDLERDAPQLAPAFRSAAEGLTQFSATIRGQSFQELSRTASEFAREKPVLLFGAAALCGFALLRIFKAGSSTSLQPRRAATDRSTRYEPYSPSIMPHSGESHDRT